MGFGRIGEISKCLPVQIQFFEPLPTRHLALPCALHYMPMKTTRKGLLPSLLPPLLPPILLTNASSSSLHKTAHVLASRRVSHTILCRDCRYCITCRCCRCRITCIYVYYSTDFSIRGRGKHWHKCIHVQKLGCFITSARGGALPIIIHYTRCSIDLSRLVVE